MPRITTPLNDTQIKQAKFRDKEFLLFDGNGLAIRIKPNGTKLWLFIYNRPYTTKRTKLSLGTYPELSLANARQKRQEYRELLLQKIDPKEYRDDQSLKNIEAQTNTLEHIASQWLEIKKSSVTKDHANDIWRSLELHVLPDIGKIPIYKIKAKSTIKVLQPIAKRGTLETVKRLCQRLNEVMIYAVNSGIIDSNPLSGIYKAFSPPIKKNMPTIKPEQLPVLMRTISRASIKFTTRCLIEWQMHTMVRPSEAAGTRWEEIDFKKKLWSIPATRMKKKRPHQVPLSNQMIGLLEEMKAISHTRDFVFPSDREPRRHINASTANMALKRMGYDGILVAHGLRALASTILNEQGFEPDVIEAALAHVEKNDIRRAYNRADYLEKRRILMAWWSEYIEINSTINNSKIIAINTIRQTG